jgi:hypothetical protein
VRLDDVPAFKERRTSTRRAILDQLTQDSLADGTYFMTAAEADAAFNQERSR